MTDIAEFDLAKIDEVRSVWQFYRDRRPETYGKLTELQRRASDGR